MAPPHGLTAERLTIGGVEHVIFSSDAGRSLSVLSEAERAVCALLIGGASNAEIARARNASVRTVANQVASSFRKLGVASRFELIARYARDIEQ